MAELKKTGLFSQTNISFEIGKTRWGTRSRESWTHIFAFSHLGKGPYYHWKVVASSPGPGVLDIRSCSWVWKTYRGARGLPTKNFACPIRTLDKREDTYSAEVWNLALPEISILTKFERNLFGPVSKNSFGRNFRVAKKFYKAI